MKSPIKPSAYQGKVPKLNRKTNIKSIGKYDEITIDGKKFIIPSQKHIESLEKEIQELKKLLQLHEDAMKVMNRNITGMANSLNKTLDDIRHLESSMFGER